MKMNNIYLALGIIGLILAVLISQLVYPSSALRSEAPVAAVVQSPDTLASVVDYTSRTLTLKNMTKWQGIKKDALKDVFVTGYTLDGAEEDFQSSLQLSVKLPDGVTYTPFVFFETDGIQTIIDEVQFFVSNGEVTQVQFPVLGAGNYYLLAQHKYSTDADALFQFTEPTLIQEASESVVGISLQQNLNVIPYAHTLTNELGFGVTADRNVLQATYVMEGEEFVIDTSEVSVSAEDIALSFPLSTPCAELQEESLQVEVMLSLVAQELSRPLAERSGTNDTSWVVSEGSAQQLQYEFIFTVPTICA